MKNLLIIKDNKVVEVAENVQDLCDAYLTLINSMGLDESYMYKGMLLERGKLEYDFERDVTVLMNSDGFAYEGFKKEIIFGLFYAIWNLQPEIETADEVFKFMGGLLFKDGFCDCEKCQTEKQELSQELMDQIKRVGGVDTDNVTVVPEEIRKAIQEAIEKHGGVSALVNEILK